MKQITLFFTLLLAISPVLYADEEYADGETELVDDGTGEMNYDEDETTVNPRPDYDIIEENDADLAALDLDTAWLDENTEENDADIIPSDKDIIIANDSDASFISDDDQNPSTDASEPNYDDYNFPDVSENTDHDSIKTERITADGCSLLFVQ